MKLSSKVQACKLSPIRKFHPYVLAAEAMGRTVHHLNIGQPDSYSSSAKLYDANGAIATDYSSDCFIATLSALGPVALIDVNEATGDTAVTSVKLNRSALSLEEGETGKLSATVRPD